MEANTEDGKFQYQRSILESKISETFKVSRLFGLVSTRYTALGIQTSIQRILVAYESRVVKDTSTSGSAR